MRAPAPPAWNLERARPAKAIHITVTGMSTGTHQRLSLAFQPRGPARGEAAPANIEAAPNAEVWSVLYRITRRDLLHLDSAEGMPGRRYHLLWLDASDIGGNSLRAVTYIANGKEEDGNPSLRYITLLREGARAHGLPDHWIRFLEEVKPAR